MDKKGNIFKIFVVIICILLAVVFALAASGKNLPFMQTYKNNFKQNISGICNMLGITLPIETQLYLDDMSEPEPKPTMTPASEQEELERALGYTEQEEPVPTEGTAELTAKEPVKEPSTKSGLPIALDAAENARYAVRDGAVLCVNETHYRAFSSGGKLLWDEAIQIQSPSVTVKGKYVLINETGAKKISLYKGKKLLFTTKTEGNIITADLSENGDVVAVTEKEYFKGQVVVYNKSGKLIFAWDSGSYNILDAAVSENRHVAISLLNTDEGADSFVTCFGVNGKNIYKTDNFKDTIIFDIAYSGKKLNAVSESRCIGLSDSGKTLWDYGYDGRLLKNYDIAADGSKLLLFENATAGEITVLSAGGKAYSPIKTEAMPDAVSIRKDYISYNSGRDVIITDFKGKKIMRTSCAANIRGLLVLDSKHTFCVYSQSVQFKKLEKVKKQTTVTAPEQSPEAENQGN